MSRRDKWKHVRDVASEHSSQDTSGASPNLQQNQYKIKIILRQSAVLYFEESPGTRGSQIYRRALY